LQATVTLLLPPSLFFTSSLNIKYTPEFVRQLHLALAPASAPFLFLSPSHPQAAGCYQFCRSRRRRRLQAVDCSSSSMSSAFCCCVYIFECILPPSYLPLYSHPCVCRTLFFFSSYKRTFCLFSTYISPLLLFYLFFEKQF